MAKWKIWSKMWDIDIIYVKNQVDFGHIAITNV